MIFYDLIIKQLKNGQKNSEKYIFSIIGPKKVFGKEELLLFFNKG